VPNGDKSESLRDCQEWFQAYLGFHRLPVPAESIRFVSQNHTASGIFKEELQTFRALSFSLIPGFLIALSVLFYTDGVSESLWNLDIPALVLLTLGYSVFCCFPVLALFLRRKTIVVSRGRWQSAILAHELAHAYHNSNAVRSQMHFLIDIVLLPFFISYGEGIATWVEKQYCASRGLPFDLRKYPLRYRSGYRLVAFVAYLLGKRFVTILLKYL